MTIIKLFKYTALAALVLAFAPSSFATTDKKDDKMEKCDGMGPNKDENKDGSKCKHMNDKKEEKKEEKKD